MTTFGIDASSTVREFPCRRTAVLASADALRFLLDNLDEDRIRNIIHRADIIINLKTIWREKKPYSYEKNILNFNKQIVDLINRTDKNKVFIFFSD